MNFPPLPELPPFLSGRSVIVIDGAILESNARAAELLAPLRELAPEIDSFGRIPASALVQVHMDPPQPTPAVTRHRMLSSLPEDAVASFVAASEDPGLFVAKLRHLGGAVARPAADAGAVSAVEGDYLVHGIAVPPVPEAIPAAMAAANALVDALAPWAGDGLALTFIDGGADRAPGFGASIDRLRALKADWDPRNVFAAANPVGD